LRDGILRLPPDALLNGRAAVTRGQAIETLARAVLKAQTKSGSELSSLKSEIAAPSEKSRLVIAASHSNSVADKQRFERVNATAPGLIGRGGKDGAQATTVKNASTTPGIVKTAAQTSYEQGSDPDGLVIGVGAWLFRSLGGESYAVNH